MENRRKKTFDWKQFANFWKIFVAVEVSLMYILGPFFGHPFPILDLVGIGIFQYALFSPIDASILIANLRGSPASTEKKE